MVKLLEYNTGHSIVAFSTMRGEGYGNYDGFNITDYCGDNEEHVRECRRWLCEELGIEDKRLIMPRQTHGDKTVAIDTAFLQMGKDAQRELLYGVDAIMTDLPRICIGVSTADCIPVLLCDSRRGAVAAVHAGWRGTVARIACRTIEEMRSRYGSRANEIKAIIGPGISLDAFEVGDEVYETFRTNGFPMEKIAGLYPTADSDRKWHIDLWEANRILLTGCGVLPQNIEIAGVCTFKSHNEFFSARRLGINSGRIFNGILIK